MPETSQSIEKITQKTLTKDILNLLSQNDLSISEISSKLKTDKIQSIIAVLSELQYFGLVIPIENQNKSKKDFNNQLNSDPIMGDFLSNPLDNWLSPLGIPIRDYHTLWESLNQNKGIEHYQFLKNTTFKIPEPLKQRFKNENQSNKKKKKLSN
ncbi:MAG: hypothetical protein ACXAB2_05235 [Candidatus Hodarchaeales archaeon]|jgi:hypothetical protein